MIFVRGNWFFILLVLVVTVFMCKPYLYAVQQDNYRASEVMKARKLRAALAIDLLCAAVFAAIYVGVYFVQSRAFWGFLIVTFFFVAEIALYFVEEMPDKKKPFKFTRRAVRTYAAEVLTVTAAFTAALAHLNYVAEGSYWRYVLFFFLPLTFPMIFIAVLCIVNVFERANNRRYERMTRKTLNSFDGLIKIGITGSYGKTSVKNFLAEMLSKKYRVLATPESYNTPMGIAKTVSKLDASYGVFIAEMGARRVGDIKRLMKIVRPEIGVLTGINEQHIATFKSFDNIKREKLRVITMLSGEGFAAAADSIKPIVEEYQEKYLIRTPVYAGFDETDEVYASDVGVAENGSVFNLHFGDKTYVAATRLLGEHNIQNLLLAAATAYYLGVSPENIVAAISSIEAVPHRLHLTVANGIKIIDDTFNSNPDGARCALEVLSLFAGRKVVVTPGLVELGGREREENRKLGTELASVADMVILIGEARTEPVKRGLLDAGFAGKTAVYSSLSEAQAAFKDVLHLGDVLLLLNDLPDIYDE